jgi:exopolysaccharide production protein ExoQ
MYNIPTASVALALIMLPTLVAYLNRSTALALTLAALAGLVHLIKTRSPWPRPDAVMVTFLLWGALSMLWEYDSGLALHQVFQLVGLLIAGTVLCAMIKTLPSDQLKTIRMAAIGGAILAVLLFYVDKYTDCGVLRLDHLIRQRGVMAQCYLPSEKNMPLILSIFIPLLFGWALPAKEGLGPNWPRLALVSVFLAAIVLAARSADSHGTYLALAAAAATWIGARLLTAKIMGRLIATLSVLFVLSAPLIPAMMPQPKELAESHAWVPSSTRHRVMIWQFAAERIAERPLLGWGLNGARSIPGNKDKTEIWLQSGDGTLFPMLQDRLPLHPHDFALQIWLETGAVGALLVSALLWRLFTRMSLQWGTPALSAGVAALMVGSVSFGIWQAWWLACLWFIAAITPAMLAKQNQPSRQSPGGEDRLI